MGRKNSGFTLVELLIVIVIIAILAAISVVAYKGIQSRTINSAYQSSATQWINTLKIYHAEVGSYPDGSLEYTCLTQSDLVATETFDQSVCMEGDGWQVAKDVDMISNIKEVTGATIDSSDLPTFSYQNLNGHNEYYRGILYLTRNGGHGITYPLKGSGSSCVQGSSYFAGADGFVACQLVLDGDPYAGL